MDDTSSDGLFRHAAPTHAVMRVFLAGAGATILVLSGRELWRGVWPANLLSLPFLLILLGAIGVGGAMILAGLFGLSLTWTIGRGRVEIEATTPFGRRRHSFSRADIAGFTLSEYEGDGGPSTWKVVMTTTAGQRFESRVFQGRTPADELKRQMEQAFYG